MSTQPPTWAKTLVRKACRAEGRHQPKLTWNNSKKGYTTGRAWGWSDIHITAGGSRLEQKMTILHELAHCFAPYGDVHGHEFWRVCWRLYRRHNIPVKFAIAHEYPAAKQAYRKIQRAKRKPVEMEVVA